MWCNRSLACSVMGISPASFSRLCKTGIAAGNSNVRIIQQGQRWYYEVYMEQLKDTAPTTTPLPRHAHVSRFFAVHPNVYEAIRVLNLSARRQLMQKFRDFLSTSPIPPHVVFPANSPTITITVAAMRYATLRATVKSYGLPLHRYLACCFDTFFSTTFNQ